MKRLFMISRQRWTLWLGLILAICGVILTSVLSVNAFMIDAAHATGESKPTFLAKPTPVDSAARQEYLAAREAAELAKQQETAETEQRANLAATGNLATATQKTPATNQDVVAVATYDKLIIPKIGLNARLATVGLTSEGAVDVNATLPGWWNGSARPGSNGAAFVDGHNTGIFRSLGALAVGDQVTVEFANGETYTYTVAKVEIRDLNDPNLMHDALRVYGGAAQSLNLMTCAGSPTGNTYTHRLVIYATR